MKVSDRITLNRGIAAELHRRYTFAEATEFLKAFKLSSAQNNSWDDDEDYYRQTLSRAQLGVLAEIVEDLGLPSFSSDGPLRILPKIWQRDTRLRVFISHLSVEKLKATRLRDSLSTIGMSAFVAHEDIEPTLEWQVQIERALANCELFVSLHTPGFAKSLWTQQEVGFAVGRGFKVIAVRMGEDPTGFIQKNQALSRGEKRAEQLATEIADLVLQDERLKDRYSAIVDDSIDDDIPF